MMSLLNYELEKIFNSTKWAGLTMMLLAVFFLISGFFSGRQVDWNGSPLIQVVTTVSFIGLGILMAILFIAPMVASIVSYHRDLNDQHAVFEAYIPHNGWKRLAAKYISYALLILTGIVLSALIAWLTFQVVRGAAPAQVQFEIDNTILELLRRMDSDPAAATMEILRFLAGTVLSLTTGTIFFTFFITLHAVLRHRIKGATPLTFLAAALGGMALSWLGETLFAGSGPLSGQLLRIPTEAYFSFAVSLAALALMGWMLEHKTELK